MSREPSHTRVRAVGGLQIAIGTAALVVPRRLCALFGMDPARLNGEGLVGWRLFAVRQLLLGTGNLTLDTTTRRATVAVGAADLGLFATTLCTRSIPRRTSLMGLATAAAVTATALASRPQDLARRES